MITELNLDTFSASAEAWRSSVSNDTISCYQITLEGLQNNTYPNIVYTTLEIYHPNCDYKRLVIVYVSS